MLNTKKVTIEAKSVVDGVEVMGFRALFDPEVPDELSFLHYQINRAACKTHRDIVRKDQQEFEDYAYKFQENVQNTEKGE